MRAATALAMFNAIDTIREVAEEHDKLDNMEYIDNMFILSMVSHSIASDKDKKEVMDLNAESYIIKDSASLVRLKTALDLLHEKKANKGFFKRLFG